MYIFISRLLLFAKAKGVAERIGNARYYYWKLRVMSPRSSNEKLLKIPKWNLRSFGQRSFSFIAPSLWNSLPATLRNVPTLSQFKSQLKNLVCPGLPVESKERCVCVWQLNVDGCIWIGRGGREGVEGKSMRDLGKRRRHGLVGWKERLKLVSLFEIVVWDH